MRQAIPTLLVLSVVLSACSGWLDWSGGVDPEPSEEGAEPSESAVGDGPVEVVAVDPAQVPDVLILSVDTLRADRLGFVGHADADTPRLDALAAEGVVFTEGHTPMPRTTPGLATLLTGRWPHHHGSREVRDEMVEGVITLPDVLRRAGYRTIGLTGNPAAAHDEGLDRGFDVLSAPRDVDARLASSITQKILAEAAEVPADEPLFLWAHYYDPHFPYRAPGASREGRHCDMVARLHPDGRRTSNQGGHAERALDDCLLRYDEEVTFVDEQIGVLLDRLSTGRAGRELLVVFTSDHGENLGEDDLWFQHGPSLHEASLNVPLVFRGPGIEQGGVDGRPARLEDVAPTVLDLVGLPVRALGDRIDGVSLVPRLTAEGRSGAEIPPAYAEGAGALLVSYTGSVFSGRPSGQYCVNDDAFSLCWEDDKRPRLYESEKDPRRHRDVSRDHPDEYEALLAAKERLGPHNTRPSSVRVGRWKLIDEVALSGDHVRRVVDLDTDPSETVDRSADPDAPVETLHRLLDAWLEGLPPYRPGRSSSATQQMLEELGYIE